MKPEPFIGTSLIPLNQMDKDGELYQRHAQKYVGREDYMQGIIPKLDCKWNDVVQFSAMDPQRIIQSMKEVRGDFKVLRKQYFKIHIDQILGKFDAVIFDRISKQKRGLFNIEDREVDYLNSSYQEIRKVPDKTIRYWEGIKANGGVYLLFPFIPHILVKGIIDTSEFEVCELV